MTRLRSILIALLALALSAGAVFAGHLLPAASDGGRTTAAGAAGKLVPVEAQDEDTNQTPDETTDEAVSEATTTSHPDNHGAVVSAAAQAETPTGFDNHGAYVSSIARQNSGQTTAAEKKAGHGKPEGVPPSH